MFIDCVLTLKRLLSYILLLLLACPSEAYAYATAVYGVGASQPRQLSVYGGRVAQADVAREPVASAPVPVVAPVGTHPVTAAEIRGEYRTYHSSVKQYGGYETIRKASYPVYRGSNSSARQLSTYGGASPIPSTGSSARQTASASATAGTVSVPVSPFTSSSSSSQSCNQYLAIQSPVSTPSLGYEAASKTIGETLAETLTGSTRSSVRRRGGGGPGNTDDAIIDWIFSMIYDEDADDGHGAWWEALAYTSGTGANTVYYLNLDRLLQFIEEYKASHNGDSPDDFPDGFDLENWLSSNPTSSDGITFGLPVGDAVLPLAAMLLLYSLSLLCRRRSA